MNRTKVLLENIVIGAIVLVLAQTFLEDFAVVFDWPVQMQRVLLFAGFGFDIFFTVEFVVRCYQAYRARRLSTYLWRERGWIDFAASFPLLVLNSGPTVIAAIAGSVAISGMGGMLNILKVVKAIRIARVLRLLRLLKVFRRIKNTDSVMAQRHVAAISATAVSTVVGVLLVLAFSATLFSFPSFETVYQRRTADAVLYIVDNGLADRARTEDLARYATAEPIILSVEDGDEVRYSRFDQGHLDTYYQETDYGHIQSGPIEVFVDLKPINREQAADNLRYFVIIVVMVLVFVFLYSPRFALTVTDPIHVMRRGMDEPAYSLEVRIPTDLQSDDVYRLANSYNTVFLPMKDRHSASDELESSELTLDNVGDLFSEEVE